MTMTEATVMAMAVTKATMRSLLRPLKGSFSLEVGDEDAFDIDQNYRACALWNRPAIRERYDRARSEYRRVVSCTYVPLPLPLRGPRSYLDTAILKKSLAAMWLAVEDTHTNTHDHKAPLLHVSREAPSHMSMYMIAPPPRHTTRARKRAATRDPTPTPTPSKAARVPPVTVR